MASNALSLVGILVMGFSTCLIERGWRPRIVAWPISKKPDNSIIVIAIDDEKIVQRKRETKKRPFSAAFFTMRQISSRSAAKKGPRISAEALPFQSILFSRSAHRNEALSLGNDFRRLYEEGVFQLLGERH
ncbi:hypothetical protein EDF59_104231 [Novosphingobium sp. ST904]|nr:hypothetical protein EDF59_104231 [Novosphingobium sp. ST904]